MNAVRSTWWGPPKGRLNRLEAELAACGWQQARDQVQVKLLPQDDELYVYVKSQRRVHKERAMRQQRLRRYLARLKALQRQRPRYDTLLTKLGAAQALAGRAASLVRVRLPPAPDKQTRKQRTDFDFEFDRAKLRTVRKREGRYLLRSNLTATDPAQLWQFYLQLVEVEAAFKNLKSELSIRPIFHQREDRIEAHIFVCSVTAPCVTLPPASLQSFLAYCVQVTLSHQLKQRAPGLTPRQALDKLAAIQMLDVHFPTTDGRELIFTRYTEPEADQQLILAQLNWSLPAQAPPRITAYSTLATQK